MSIARRSFRRSLLSGAVILLAAGCAAPERLRLEQPFAPASQRALRLEPRTATVAEIGGRIVGAADFPLPGAKDGPLAFTLYVEADQTATAEDAPPRGFLIQHVGALAGKSLIVGGSARATSPLFDASSTTFALDLQFADGARLSGNLTARRDEPTVRMLQRRYRPDVAALQKPPATAAAAEEATPADDYGDYSDEPAPTPSRPAPAAD